MEKGWWFAIFVGLLFLIMFVSVNVYNFYIPETRLSVGAFTNLFPCGEVCNEQTGIISYICCSPSADGPTCDTYYTEDCGPRRIACITDTGDSHFTWYYETGGCECNSYDGCFCQPSGEDTPCPSGWPCVPGYEEICLEEPIPPPNPTVPIWKWWNQ